MWFFFILHNFCPWQPLLINNNGCQQTEQTLLIIHFLHNLLPDPFTQFCLNQMQFFSYVICAVPNDSEPFRANMSILLGVFDPADESNMILSDVRNHPPLKTQFHIPAYLWFHNNPVWNSDRKMKGRHREARRKCRTRKTMKQTHKRG